MVRFFKSLFFLILTISIVPLFSQKIIQGNNAHQLINGAKTIRYVDHRQAPDFILLDNSVNIGVDQAMPWMKEVLGLGLNESLNIKRIEKDKLGMVHYVYQHSLGGIPIEHSEYRLHTLNDQVKSLNGEFYKGININLQPSISSSAAINAAKNYVNASAYRWENISEEKFIKLRTNNPLATYAPQPELVIVPKNGNYLQPEFRLAWKMDIYATQPLSRQWVYVDAQTAEVIWKVERIHDIDAVGSATTAFSGARTITSDSFGGSFRLRETGRGNGIETYDMNTGTDYNTAVDFTDADNNWVGPSPAIDQYAYDAHWGAEMTYDYFMNVHGRNSINGSGFALISYVHYDVNYSNAFWDGQEMTYGDGGGGTFNEPLTTIDIAGHEIAHGLTTFTADLVYQDEPGGLNESFSDIFGVTIDNFARGTTGTPLWRMGEECTTSGNGIRLMSNPNSMGDPDTYLGTNWIAAGGPDYGGVHSNSGVQNFWYYLMCQGGVGTNDNGDAYNVTAIGMADAADIAFRNLTIYLGSNSQFADARFYAILSAQDLFGGCSPEVETTTNAWYAVGVGPAYVANVTADLSVSATSICNSPATINFNNLSNNGISYTWYFGDGSTSAATDPVHSYSSNGTYSVSLAVDGGLCGTDSVAYNSLINVNIPNEPSGADISYCNPSVATLNASGTGNMVWYASLGSTTPLFTGNPYVTGTIPVTTTFYVEDQINNGGGNVGPVNNSFGTGGNHNNTSTQYLEFSINQALTINTVDVVSGGSGNRNIQVWDEFGTLVNTITVNIPAGNSTVTLDLDLQPGNYRIGGTEMNLYRNNAGASYPYSLAGFVDITGSSAGGAFYYYFYDWVVSSTCTSERTPITVTIGGPTANFNYNAAGTVISFNNTSTNATGYFWDFGGGNTSNLSNPTFDFGGEGTFPVMLIADNGDCSDTTYINVIISGLGLNELELNSSLYPNPFNSYINLSLQLPANGIDLTIDAYNAIGQKVQQLFSGSSVSGEFIYSWNTFENLAPGVYYIKINYGGKQIVKQAIKY